MHRLLPRLFGLHAVIAGMDQDVHRRLAPLIEDVVALDAAVGAASLQFMPGKPETAAALAGHLDDSRQLEHALHRVVAEAIGGYAVPVQSGLRSS
jgi:hypothetical protein